MVAQPKLHLFPVLSTTLIQNVIITIRKNNMLTRSILKFISIVLFVTIATLIAYSMDISFWMSSHLAIEKTISNNREAIHVPSYAYGMNPPIFLGGIKNTDNAYFRLKLRFRADDTEGYPNLFQTAPSNRGLRMEISGTTAAIIVPDKESANGLRGMTLTTTLEKSRWYVLEVEALNGAFVRATLDGIGVANISGKGLSMDMSQLIVGAGFDDSRVFKGEMDNISIIKGNLPLPHQGLKITYLIIATLMLLFIFVLWKAVSEHNEVQSVIGKIALLALPLVIIVGYLEYHMSFLNTNYYTKRVALEQQFHQVEVLVLGSSTTFYGVAPEAFSSKGFNLAFPGSGMYFDAQLAESYSKRMPHLKTVVLTANYFTMGLDYSTFSQSWRQFALRQNFGIPVRLTVGLPLDWKFWIEPRNFSKIALHGEVFTGTQLLSPVDITASATGWFNGGDVPGDPSKKLGIAAAEAHNAVNNVANYNKNLSYFDGLVEDLLKKNITVVMVTLPTDASYYRNLDKDKSQLMNRTLVEFADKHQIKFCDYTKDPRFSIEDFTWEMPDHMNALGAMKFSRILDKDVINPQ